MIRVARIFIDETMVTISIGLDMYSVRNVPNPITGLETKLVSEYAAPRSRVGNRY